MNENAVFALAAWGGLRTELIWCYCDRVPTSGLIVDSTEPHEVVWRMLRGTARIEIDGRAWDVREGHWVFLPRGPRRHQLARDNRLLSVHFRADWPWGEPLWHPADPVVFAADGNAGFGAASEALQSVLGLRHAQVISRGENPVSAHRYFALQSAFQAWLGALSDVMAQRGVVPAERASSDPRVERVLHLLNECALHTPPSARAICRAAGLSPAQCDRVFRDVVGMSPRRFFEPRRWRSARDGLADVEQPIKAVAMNHGFRDLPSFARWCRRLGGGSPRHLRETLAGRVRV